MEIRPAWLCMKDIIQHTDIAMVEKENCSVAQERKLSCVHIKEMPVLSGASLKTHPVSKESTVLYFGTNQNTGAATLSDRLMQSLISVGLVKGIIPMSTRKGSSQLTLDAVLNSPDGESAGEQK